MILTRYDRLMICELPKNLTKGLEFLTDNYHSLTQNLSIAYPDESISYEILSENSNSHPMTWRSHQRCICCYFIIHGEEIIEVNDIDKMKAVKSYEKSTNTVTYYGVTQSHIRLQEDNIIILNPEDAYRFHRMKNCIKILIKIPIDKDS